MALVKERSNPGGALSGSLRITRTNTSEKVADVLRGEIMKGQLVPGTALRDAAVASTLGVSRNTVREAIKLLSRERLVTHQAHRGAVVTRLTPADVADIYRVRGIIEGASVDALAHMSQDRIAPLVDGLDTNLDDLRRAVEAGDYQAMVEADVAFHRHLVQFRGSPRLDEFYGRIQAEQRLCVSIVNRTYADPSALIEEHRELRDLIAAGRLAECQEQLARHLKDACEIVKGIARDQQATSDGEEEKDDSDEAERQAVPR